MVVGASILYPRLTFADASTPSPTTSESSAIKSSKPFAPKSALLPAIRAKLWIEDAHNLSQKLVSIPTGDGDNSRDETLEDLNNVLSHRPKLFLLSRGEKPLSRVSSTAFAQFTAKNGSDKPINGNGNNNNNSNNKNPLFSSSLSSPGERLSKALNRADEARQWGMLQSQESKKEQENEVRAAFNFYTQQLEFNSNSYAWTGSAEERKRRIRDDRIPTPASVIVSDLDLRDLYRNQLLTALDDATAEVNYQFRQRQRQPEQEGKSNVIVDVTDTVDLMNQVYVACTKWFDMIDAGDIEKALELVRTEQRRESSLTP